MSGRKLRSSRRIKSDTTTRNDPVIVIKTDDQVDVGSTTVGVVGIGVGVTDEKFSSDNNILSAILDANLSPKNDPTQGVETNATPTLTPELFCLDDVCSLPEDTLSRPASPGDQTVSFCNSMSTNIPPPHTPINS